MTDKITLYREGLAVFEGKDAIEFYRIRSLYTMLGAMAVGLKFQHINQTRALVLAGQRVGKVYKRGELNKARQDLKVWLDLAQLSLPVEVVQ